MVKKKEDSKLKFEIGIDYHSSRFFALLFPALYLVAMSIFCLEYKIIPGPEFLVLGVLIYAAYNERSWRVVKDWLTFITVFTSYELMNGVVGFIANDLHSGPFNFDMRLFGGVPSLILQQAIRGPVLDYMGAVFYSTYFFVPTIFALIVWKKSPKNYWKYIVSFGVLTYAALITYLFYAVSPPWLAVPNVTRILTSSVDVNLGVPVYRTMFDFLCPNLYGAFPSMHSAMPWLVFLFAFKIWRWKALPVVILPVGTWFSAVYLGEHYFVDVLGGIAYATTAFIAVERILPLLSERLNFLRKHIPQLENRKAR